MHNLCWVISVRSMNMCDIDSAWTGFVLCMFQVHFMCVSNVCDMLINGGNVNVYVLNGK